MKQRIALVAASALTAGFISVISAPAAHAGAGDTNVLANAAATTAPSSAIDGTGKSIGLISGAASVPTTATMFSNGVLSLDITAPTTRGVVTVTGGVFSSGVGTGALLTNTTVSGVAAARIFGYTSRAGVLVTPDAGVTSMTISAFNTPDTTAASTNGVAGNVLVVTVVNPLNLGANAGAASASATAPASFGVVGTPVATRAAQTAVMYDSGTLSIAIPRGTTAGSKFGVVTVSGGTITGYTAGTLTGLATIGETIEAGILVKPTAAGTLLVVKYFNDATAATSSTGGTEVDKLTVTVTTAASAGTFSASKSFVNQHSAATAGAETTNADTVGANYVANAGTGYVNFTLKDVNNLQMSTSTVLSASVTGGAVVSFDNATFSTSVSGTYGGTSGTVYVKQGTANTPVSAAVVTLSVSGTTYATKGFKIVGDVEKITLSSPKRNVTSGAGAAGFQLAVTDSAGNLIAGITPSAAATSINGSVSSVTPAVSIATDTKDQAFACSAVRGTSNITYTYTNARNVSVVSNVLPVVCAGDPYKYTASLDKASYASGAIATLTIKATDLDGNAVSDYSVLGTAGSASTAIAITCGSQMTAVTAPLDANTFTAGVATYKYAVGTTAGSYNCVVDLPKWNSTSTPQAAQTVAYTIASDGSVSNAQVLQSIVALIASINKQIQALQKLILARR
jgi:hypothetical protein